MRAMAAVTVQDPAASSSAEALESVAPSRPVTPLTIACPAQVITSTPFDCRLTLVRPEPLPAAGADLRVAVPSGLFHLSNSANARFDANARQLVLSLDRLSHGPSTLSVSLMADEAGAGRTRTLSASVPMGEARSTSSAAAAAGTEVSASGSGSGAADEAVEADRPVEAVEKAREPARFDASASILVAPGEPVILGPLESPKTPATATLLVAAAMVAALWAIRARRRTHRAAAMQAVAAPPSVPGVWRPAGWRPAAPASPSYTPSASSSSREGIALAMIGASVSLLLLFFCMPSVIETVRARTTFVSTTCTVVDSGSSGLAPEIAYVPMAIVRYEAAGRTRVASGFDVRGTMYGSNDPDASRLFTTGGRYPCWYDPAQPQRVILRQGPSATVWFALLPILLLIPSVGALLGVWRD